MSRSSLVSIVIPVLEPHPRYFTEAVASVLSQSHSNLEVLVVEDPSTSAAGPLLAAFNDSRIRHIVNSHRTSLVEQRNRGLVEARADLVALLDADDIAEPHRIREQVTWLEVHPDVAVLGTQLTVIDGEGRALGFRRYPKEHDAIAAAMPRYNPIAQPSVLFRKTAVLRAGGYRWARDSIKEDPVRLGQIEDYELWCRMLRQGYRFANHPDCLIRYRVHPGGTKATKLRSMLRATLDVKTMYFAGQMSTRAKVRMWGERLLLLFPPRLVARLFQLLHYRRLAAKRAESFPG